MTGEITAHPRLRPSLPMMAFLTACEGGNGYAGDDGAGSSPPPPLLVATFESIQANVFTPVCVECHGGATAPLGLRLDETSSYGLLVGISSVEQPGVPRVAPGNPNASYLYRSSRERRRSAHVCRSSIADTYRVHIVGTGPANVQDVSGRVLDGELLPRGLPSGDRARTRAPAARISDTPRTPPERA